MNQEARIRNIVTRIKEYGGIKNGISKWAMGISLLIPSQLSWNY